MDGNFSHETKVAQTKCVTCTWYIVSARTCGNQINMWKLIRCSEVILCENVDVKGEVLWGK